MDQVICRLNKLAKIVAGEIKEIGSLSNLSVEIGVSKGKSFTTCEGGEAWEVDFRYVPFGAIVCRLYLIRPSRKYNHVLVSPHISNSNIIAVPRYNSLINQYPREVEEFRKKTRQVQQYLKSISGGYEIDDISVFRDKAWIIDPKKFFALKEDSLKPQGFCRL